MAKFYIRKICPLLTSFDLLCPLTSALGTLTIHNTTNIMHKTRSMSLITNIFHAVYIMCMQPYTEIFKIYNLHVYVLFWPFREAKFFVRGTTFFG